MTAITITLYRIMSAIFNAGLQGIQAGLERISTNAHAIATSTDNNTADLAGNLVDLKIAKTQTEASVAVVKVADEILGTLLDELA